MAGILRESCLEIIDKTYEAINSSLDGKNVDSNIWLKDLSARMERINRLRKKKDYLETIKCLDRDGLQEYFNLVGRMARELRLPIYRCFVDMEIAEEQELLTLYANGVVHERGKSIEIDQGMRIRFRLESKNQDAKQRVEVEWDKKRKGKEEQEGFYEALNDIKNMVDTDSLDREFAFEQVGEYKVSAAVYKYMKKSLIKKIKTLAQEYEFTVIVNEGEELYEGMEFKDKLWEALSAVDWKGVVQDSMFDVTSQLPIMVGTIVLLSGVLIAISVSPIGWLAPMVGTAMQVFGLSGAVEDVVKGIYMFTDAVLRIRDAKSKAGMMQATQHLEDAFRQVAPSLMLDVLLFLGGKRVAKNPTGSDLVQEAPRKELFPEKPLEIKDILGKEANDLIEVPDNYLLVRYIDEEGIVQTQIRRKDSSTGEFLFVDDDGYIRNKKDAAQWKRSNTVGSTPKKTSKTGQAVIQRMELEGKILRDKDRGSIQVLSEKDNEWYPLEKCDMSHKEACVTYWNREGRRHGPLSQEVREWMENAENYYLEYYGHNRSAGGRMTERYLPPEN